jgi:peroxiredoxin
MRLNRRSGLLAAGCMAVIGALALAQPNPTALVGKAAPAFSAKGSDGKTHSLDSLTSGGQTVVLYYISETCPVNAEALPHVKKIAAAHAKNPKAKIIGVFNGTEAEFNAWNKKEKVPFTTLFDPDLKIIRAHKAAFSPWMNVIGSDKKVARTWPGYSRTTLQNLNSLLASKAGTAVPKLDYPGAPTELSGG